jgi:hypothetical protein
MDDAEQGEGGEADDEFDHITGAETPHLILLALVGSPSGSR